MADSSKCPKRIRESLERYVEHRIPTGDFLAAVLSNNLKMAIGTADAENLERLPDIVAYCYWEIPSNCWGSKNAVRNWLEG